MNRYSYNGPVMLFGVCVDSKWIGETLAGSEKKARSNLSYQYKKQNNLLPTAMITIPGQLKIVN